MRKLILSKIWKIECDNSQLMQRIKEELSLYEESFAVEDFKLEIKLVDHNMLKNLQRKKGGGVLRIKEHNYMLECKINLKNNLITIYINREKNSAIAYLKKWNSMGFETAETGIGRIIHEVVFIPITLINFSKDMILLHASSVLDINSGIGMVFTGYGGSGKTKIEEYILNNFSGTLFLSDDILLVSLDGRAYPNFNYPKIYGYNVKKKSPLESKILANRGLSDRLQWYLKNTFNDSSVRRRIDPRYLYDGRISKTADKIKIFILSDKERQIENEEAVKMLYDIILDEYLRIIFNPLEVSDLHKLSERIKTDLKKGINSLIADNGFEVIFTKNEETGKIIRGNESLSRLLFD